MTRILVFTGKGGVGKTTVAAAHAVHSAKEGKKTLLVSTDMAHNLSDLFQMPVGKKTAVISENLYALEVDPNYVLEEEFQEMCQAFMKFFSSAKLSEDSVGRLCAFPGMDELVSLLKIMDIYENEDYERIIVDCAPTGETLSLLKFPELLSWYMEKFLPVEKVAMKVLRPIAKAAFKVELPNQKAVNEIEGMYIKMRKLQELLKDRSVTTIRLVAVPEKMVVEETKRNYMYMNLYDFLVDGIYINRILPKDMENPFFEQWLNIQEEYIQELKDTFVDIPIYYVPWYDSDVNGLSGVCMLEEDVLRGKEVFQINSRLKGEIYEKTDSGYTLSISIPCAKKEELSMHESGSDIILKTGNFKRNIPKPYTLRNFEIAGASFENDRLKIRFLPMGGEESYENE